MLFVIEFAAPLYLFYFAFTVIVYHMNSLVITWLLHAIEHISMSLSSSSYQHDVVSHFHTAPSFLPAVHVIPSYADKVSL